MKELFGRASLALACIWVSSCWVPEQFEATLVIEADRQYEFMYDGTIAYGPALAAIQEAGQLSRSDEADLARGASDLRASPGVVSAEYVGRGRFHIRFKEAGSVESGKTLFLDIIEFKAEPAGGIRITGPDIPAEDWREFNSVDLNVDGTIRLISRVPVVEHNAESTPWFGGLFGSHKWHLTAGQAEMPTALIR